MSCARIGARAVGLVVLSVLSACTATLLAGDILVQLGLQEPDANRLVIDSIGSGTVSITPIRKMLVAVAPGARAAVVSEALTWAKTYTATRDFAVRYSALREQQKPEAPPSAEQRFAGFVADQTKQIAEMKRTLESLPPEARQEAEANIRRAETMFSDPDELAIMKEGWAEQAAAEQTAYRADLAAWQDEYPIAAQALIARRLRAFLDLTGTIDFDAALVNRGTSITFADPRLESKPRMWKQCFRAGRPAVDAARAFATSWLAEIEKRSLTTIRPD